MNFVAIDFETANRARSSACSIGMAKVRNGKVTDTFYQLIRPIPNEFEFINIAIHGISPEMVADAPTFLDLWPDIQNFVEDDILLGHNVVFEQSVINKVMEYHGLPQPSFEYLCTLYMSRVNYPRRLGYSLPDIYKDIFQKDVNHHNALEDAVACAELGVHLISMFREQDVKELMKVLYVGQPISKRPEWKNLTGIKSSKDQFDQTHPLFEKTVVITGALSTMSRESAVRNLVDVGGRYTETLSSKTNYLVVGDQDRQIALYGKKSSKMLKAENFKASGKDIQIISEAEFQSLLIYKSSK